MSPDRALCLPTFSHFAIVDKTSLSLSFSLSLSLSLSFSLPLSRSLSQAISRPRMRNHQVGPLAASILRPLDLFSPRTKCLTGLPATP